jgi:putative salt-induced outer membrane protein YdiY
MFDRGVVPIVVAGYIVDHYCLRFDRGVVTSHSNMNHSSVKPHTVLVDNIDLHNNMNHSSVKHQTVMVDNIDLHNNMNHFSVKPDQRSGSYCCGWLYC